MWRAAYDRWLMPERPGLRQFLIAVVAWLLPLAFLHTDEGSNANALAVSITVGCGLGIAWSVSTGARWLRAAPVSAAIVLLACFASAANVELVPRWDTLVLAQRAKSAMEFYVNDRLAGRHPEAPTYSTCLGRAACAVDADASGKLRYLWTPEPIQRWSPVGFRPSCYVLVRADGGAEIARDAADLARARAAASAVP
jgi:hypothetical protein